MQKIDFHSYEQQDEFIVNIFEQKRDGLFLDIGCAHPVVGSNTYTLDSQFSWNGYCFDLYPILPEHWNRQTQTLENYRWVDKRRAPWIQMDVVSEEFTEFLKAHITPDMIVDYISLDVDMPGENLSLRALKRVLDAGVKFKALTMEHEYHTYGDKYKLPASILLEDRGFVPIVNNMRLYGGEILPDKGSYSEDWWIHKDYFEEGLLTMNFSNIWYFDAIERIRRFKNKKYMGHRHCNQAFPNQHDYYMTERDGTTHVDRAPWWRGAFSPDLV